MSAHTHDHDSHAHHDHTHGHAHDHGHDAHSCCAHDAAPVLEQLATPVTGTQGSTTPIRILQMDCPTEEALLRKKLGGMESVTGLEFNLMQRVLTVTHAPDALQPILDAVRSLGFTPELADAATPPPAPEPAKSWSPWTTGTTSWPSWPCCPAG